MSNCVLMKMRQHNDSFENACSLLSPNAAQLICPIGFDDPFNTWQAVQPQVTDRLPLRDVTFKNPISGNYTTIGRLPIRFLPSSASIFRETDHPFRWFLAPYVHIYFVTAETSDSYKQVKASIKQWVDAHTSLRRYSCSAPFV